MDMTFFHIDLLLKLYCLFEKTKNKQKRGHGWPIFLKKTFFTSFPLATLFLTTYFLVLGSILRASNLGHFSFRQTMLSTPTTTKAMLTFQ